MSCADQSHCSTSSQFVSLQQKLAEWKKVAEEVERKRKLVRLRVIRRILGSLIVVRDPVCRTSLWLSH